MDSEKSIGKLILIELAKTDVVGPLETAGDLLLPTKVEVKSPEGETFQFPFHRSIIDDEIHQLREEKGTWNLTPKKCKAVQFKNYFYILYPLGCFYSQFNIS